MIDIISNWAGEIVVSLVIVTLIEMLLPENKTKKYVKTVIGVYIIFCIISPFINKEDFGVILEKTQKKMEQIQIDNQVSNQQDADNSIETLYIQEFEKDVVKRVEELGYEVKKCEVNIEIDATKENAGINSIKLEIGDKINNTTIQVDSIEKVEISINSKEEGNNNDEEKETIDTQKIKEFLSDYYEITTDKIKVIQG